MSQLNYLYHSVEPDAFNAAGYTEFDTLDFSVDFSGRSMVAGSVRFEGELRVRDNVQPGGNDILDGARVVVDHMIGAHALVQSCVTQTLNHGIIENVTNLPRLAKMKTSATKDVNDMCQSDMLCELRSPDKKIQEKLMLRKTPSDIGGGAEGQANNQQHRGSSFANFVRYSGGVLGINLPAYENPDFSLKPAIVLNQVVGGSKLVNYTTTGTIKISLNLGRNAEVLYGEDMVNHAYTIINPRICFVSVPEQAKQAPISLRSSVCLKSNIVSTLSNTSSRVPSICDSCSLSFIQLARENNAQFNNTALEQLPNVTAVRFMFNDSTNKYVAYELKTTPEILGEGLKALSTGTATNDVRLDKLAANEGYIAGLKFGEAVDLSRQKFSVQIASGVQTANPYCMYQYFHSLVSF